MKKLTCILHTLIFSSTFSVEPKSLKQSAIDQILRFSTFTPQQKQDFNQNTNNFIGEILQLNDGTLDWANLSGITLGGADFQKVHFNGTNFYQAKFIGCRFQGATFENVNFQEADFSESELEGVCFKGAKLQGATLTPGLKLPYYFRTGEILKYYSDTKDPHLRKTLNKIIRTGSFDFIHQNLTHLDLQGIQLHNCNLSHINLTGSDLTNAEFENSDLSDIHFSFVKLLKDFPLPEYCFSFTFLKRFNRPETPLDQKQAIEKLFKAKNIGLTGVDLKGVDVTGFPLKNIPFYSGGLSGALLNGFTIPEHQSHEDLIRQFTYCRDPGKKENLLQLLNSIRLYLWNADLRGLNLEKIDLTNAELYGAQLQKAILFDGFEIPDYQHPSDLLKRYSDAKNQEEKESLNKLFTLYSSLIHSYSGNCCNLNLRGLNLSQYDFFKTDFSNTDLTKALLPQGKIYGCDFSNAILPNGFKVPAYQNPRELLQLYSDSKDEELKQNLNTFFDLQPLELENQDLKNLNLQGLNLKNAKLNNCKLQGTLLYEGFKVPNYTRASDLIKVYAQSQDPKVRQNLNKLFDIIQLNTTNPDDQTPLSQQEKNFTHLDLRGVNLKNADFQELDFRGSDFTNAEISFGVNLRGTKWAQDFILPDDLSKENLKTFYQHMNKTERNIYLFLKTCDVKGYSTNLSYYQI